MKTPPPQDDHVAVLASEEAAALPIRDGRFLLFIGFVLVAVAIGFKSDVVPPGQTWSLAALLLLIAVPATFAYLRTEETQPQVEHFIPAVIGAVTLAGVSDPSITPDIGRYLLMTGAFGLAFAMTGRMDYMRLRNQEKRGHLFIQESILALLLGGAYVVVLTIDLAVPLRLAWVFFLSFIGAYRSFRVNGEAISPNRAVLYSLIVAQVVTSIAGAIAALALYLIVGQGTEAVMLLLAWYINRGLIRHTVDETFTRNVVIEYAAFAAFLVFLFVYSYQPPR